MFYKGLLEARRTMHIVRHAKAFLKFAKCLFSTLGGVSVPKTKGFMFTLPPNSASRPTFLKTYYKFVGGYNCTDKIKNRENVYSPILNLYLIFLHKRLLFIKS